MIRGGYLLKLARIDLTRKEVRIQEVDPQFATKYIGGRGWGARILWEEVPPDADPLSPANKLCILTGPLTGVLVPGAGKTSFNFISPKTGLYGDSNVGGMLGVELKQAGFDGLILEGISQTPVLIHVVDGIIEILDARDYWGMGIYEADEAIKQDFRNRSVTIALIGPAGENLVPIACVSVDVGRQAGRAGVGAVMGSKKVKAIVVEGTQDIPVANPEKLYQIFTEALEKLCQHKDHRLWVRVGTMCTVAFAQEWGALPTRNFQTGVYERWQEISGDALEQRIKVGNKACFACPMMCGQMSYVRSGPYRGTVVEGPEYETTAMLGSNCALPDIETVARANYICDDLGLDTISAGSILAFAMECFERELITKDDVNGLELRFGNTDAAFAFLEALARREGRIGELFADGVSKAAERIGKGSEKFAMHVKGLEISAYEHRAAPAMALAYATCDIGAHHNRAWAITYDVKVGRDTYTEDKAKWVIYLQHIRPLFDCLGCCRLQWVELGLEPEYYAKFYTYATGVEVSLNDLLTASERVWNLTRCISIRRLQGRTPPDTLPPRDFEEPLPSGPYQGFKLDPEKFQELLKTYYQLRGWTENGIPTRKKLTELGLEDVADAIGAP